MTSIKLSLLVALFLGMAMFPAYSQQSQSATNEVLTTQSTVNQVVPSDHKEVVTINKRFAYGIAIDLMAMLLIFGLIYFPNYRNKEFMFTFFLFNIIIFIITFVLNKTNISMGAAFGLFAVFSMLRYRTEGISMKEMTYLLIAIALGLINAIGLELTPILVFNSIFVAFIFVLDHPMVFKQEVSRLIIYDNIELIKSGNHEQLLQDLRIRTGFNIHRFSIISIDFLKDATTITIFFYKK